MKTRLERWLQKQWYGAGVAWYVLLPLSWIFALLVLGRRYLYRWRILPSTRLPVPVIVVGNITVGGTGKTPLVIWLVEQLQKHGYSPAVISRGYGAAAVVSPVYEDSIPALVGDEPVLMARRLNCPVWVGKKRAEAAAKLLQVHPECNVIVSDDGLQHYALQRDIEIVLVDAVRNLGNGQMLPAGPLRERASRLKTVDAVVYHGSRAAGSGYSMQLKTGVFVNLKSGHLATTPFVSRHIHAVAGIGNPERFFDTLKAMGLTFHSHAFPDHHPFDVGDFAFTEDDVVLMTEKDAVKCRAFAHENWWYLPVTAVVDSSLVEQVIAKMEK